MSWNWALGRVPAAEEAIMAGILAKASLGTAEAARPYWAATAAVRPSALRRGSVSPLGRWRPVIRPVTLPPARGRKGPEPMVARAWLKAVSVPA